MIAAICLAWCLAMPPEDAWVFRDETQRAGRSVVSFRTVELTGAPGKPLDKDDQPPTGAKYGAIALGPGGKPRLGLVYHAATNAVWLDADGDGRFTPAERFVLGPKPHALTVNIPFADVGQVSAPVQIGQERSPVLRPETASKSAARTLLIRQRGDGLAFAVQGYTEGAVRLHGKRVAALLTDGDADGCFDGAGADRIWIDLDGDAKFDALTEQFALGTVITHAGTSFLIRPRPDGLTVAVRQRPAEFGDLVLGLSKAPGASLVELSAQLVSEWGELVTAKEPDKPLTVPIGKYRVDSVRLKLAGPDGKVWHYGFSAHERPFDIEIVQGKQTTHAPLGGLKMTVALNPSLTPPGSSVLVQPHLETASGLFMTRCEVAERYAENGREVQATLKLIAADGAVLDQAVSGFN